MDRQTLSIMKACEAVGVSRRTIYNWISAGKVEYVRTAGGSIRIFADTLWRDAAALRTLPAHGGYRSQTAEPPRVNLSRISPCRTRTHSAPEPVPSCGCCSTS